MTARLPDEVLPFEHHQTAHCESGVVSALLRERNAPLSEAMVFGIASGLTFAYLPFVKLGGLPLISYRMPPRSILRGVSKRRACSTVPTVRKKRSAAAASGICQQTNASTVSVLPTSLSVGSRVSGSVAGRSIT